MKIRSIVVTFVLCLLALTVGFAQNPNLGTWKLNEAKSRIPAGVGKNTTVVYSAEGSDIKVTTDGVNAAGQPAHSEWTGKFDAKPYPVIGDPNVDYRAYKAKGERTLLPAARGMEDGTVLAAAGTSCRHQVAHFAGVAAVHPAVLLASLLIPNS